MVERAGVRDQLDSVRRVLADVDATPADVAASGSPPTVRRPSPGTAGLARPSRTRSCGCQSRPTPSCGGGAQRSSTPRCAPRTGLNNDSYFTAPKLAWFMDRVFEPEMDETMRAALYDGWCDAVRHVAPRSPSTWPPSAESRPWHRQGREWDTGRPLTRLLARRLYGSAGSMRAGTNNRAAALPKLSSSATATNVRGDAAARSRPGQGEHEHLAAALRPVIHGCHHPWDSRPVVMQLARRCHTRHQIARCGNPPAARCIRQRTARLLPLRTSYRWGGPHGCAA